MDCSVDEVKANAALASTAGFAAVQTSWERLVAFQMSLSASKTPGPDPFRLAHRAGTIGCVDLAGLFKFAHGSGLRRLRDRASVVSAWKTNTSPLLA